MRWTHPTYIYRAPTDGTHISTSVQICHGVTIRTRTCNTTIKARKLHRAPELARCLIPVAPKRAESLYLSKDTQYMHIHEKSVCRSAR